MHGSCIGNTNGAAGITGVDHITVGIYGLGGIDLSQTALGHLNGHNGFIGSGRVVSNIELTISLGPGGDQVGAGLVLEELNNNIILIVGQASGQSIQESETAEIGAFGGNGRQVCDQLVFLVLRSRLNFR